MLTKKKLTTPLRTVVQPESLKALNDDIQQERRVRQQHRTESLKALNDGISTRRYVCQLLWWRPYLSTTTKNHNDNMKCPTTSRAITYQVPHKYSKSTRYKVSRTEKDREKKNFFFF